MRHWPGLPTWLLLQHQPGPLLPPHLNTNLVSWLRFQWFGDITWWSNKVNENLYDDALTCSNNSVTTDCLEFAASGSKRRWQYTVILSSLDFYSPSWCADSRSLLLRVFRSAKIKHINVSFFNWVSIHYQQEPQKEIFVESYHKMRRKDCAPKDFLIYSNRRTFLEKCREILGETWGNVGTSC